MIETETTEQKRTRDTWSDMEEHACQDIKTDHLGFDIKIDGCEELFDFDSLPFVVAELVNNCMEKVEQGEEINIQVRLGKETVDGKECYILTVVDDFMYTKEPLKKLLTKLNRKRTETPLSDISGKEGARATFKSGRGIILVRNICEELGGKLVYEATEDLRQKSVLEAAVRAVASFEVERIENRIAEERSSISALNQS